MYVDVTVYNVGQTVTGSRANELTSVIVAMLSGEVTVLEDSDAGRFQEILEGYKAWLGPGFERHKP